MESATFEFDYFDLKFGLKKGLNERNKTKWCLNIFFLQYV